MITDAGRLVWMVDGYTTSDAHPYSRAVEVPAIGRVNYIRNAVKATVDAYDGTTHLYVFAPDDPIIAAYQHLFPDLFLPASQMPADLRAHARYPETLFRVQAEIYRTYHMLDPQSFYNKEDVWDLALHAARPGRRPPADGSDLHDGDPARRDEAGIRADDALHAAQQEQPHRRHDGPVRRAESRRGRRADALQAGTDSGPDERLRLHQSGPEHFEGPDAVEPARFPRAARPDPGPARRQHFPVCGSHLHTGDRRQHAAVEEDRAGGRQPADLRRHVRAGLAQLSAGARQAIQEAAAPASVSLPGQPAPALPAGSDARLSRVRDHLRRYRELAAQGRWSEAGKELEAIEAEVKQ